MTHTDEHVEIIATVTDRWSEKTTTYAGSMPRWAWEDRDARRAWTKAKRTVILEDRTSDPRGWRVTFAEDRQ